MKRKGIQTIGFRFLPKRKKKGLVIHFFRFRQGLLRNRQLQFTLSSLGLKRLENEFAHYGKVKARKRILG